jgi:hypothetical protein
MSGVSAAHDIDLVDIDGFFLADALKYPLRPRSL